MKNKNNEGKYKLAKSITTFFIAIVISGSQLIRCKNIEENNGAYRNETKIEKTQGEEKIFEPEEHILSIPAKAKNFNNITDVIDNKKVNFPYHEGYRLIGISRDTGTVALLYENIERVCCEPTGKDDQGNYVYTDFGISDEPNKEAEENEDYQIYYPGQHIIGIPISNPDVNQQYEYHEGYEVVGFTHYVFGRLASYGGGYIVYANTEPVQCEKTSKEFIDFGTPIELKNNVSNETQKIKIK